MSIIGKMQLSSKVFLYLHISEVSLQNLCLADEAADHLYTYTW